MRRRLRLRYSNRQEESVRILAVCVVWALTSAAAFAADVTGASTENLAYQGTQLQIV